MKQLLNEKLNDVLINLIINTVEDDDIYFNNNKNNFILLKEVINNINDDDILNKYNTIELIINYIDFNKNTYYFNNNKNNFILLNKFLSGAYIKIINDILNIINYIDECIYINILYEDIIFIKEFITEDLYNLFINIYNMLGDYYI